MKRIGGIPFSMPYRGQLADGIPNRLCLSSELSRGDEIDGTESRREKHQSTPFLRNAVGLAIDHMLRHMIVVPKENIDEVPEHPMLTEVRDVLHRHQLGLKLGDNSAERMQKAPTTVAVRLRRFGLRVSRERLARSATCQEADVHTSPGILQRLRLKLGYVALKEPRPVVRFVGVAARGIDVDSNADIYALHLETTRQAASAAKQIDRREFHSALYFSPRHFL